MDTLSSSVSNPSLKIPSLPPTNREFYHFTRTPYATPTKPPQPQPHVSSTSIPNLVPRKTKTFSHNNKRSTSLPFSSLKPKPSSPILFHQKPATGYAAAIIDVVQNSNSLHSVQRDVKRLLKFLQGVDFQPAGVVVDPSMVEEVKGQAVRKVVQKGNFHGHVVALVRMLVKKNKVGIVEQVLEEFERIYDELCGTQVVLVSSERKMGEEELFGIAKSVQQLSGAVRVKVRNLVNQESFPSFAV